MYIFLNLKIENPSFMKYENPIMERIIVKRIDQEQNMYDCVDELHTNQSKCWNNALKKIS